MVKSVNMVMDDSDYMFLQRLKNQAGLGWRAFLLEMGKFWAEGHPDVSLEEE